MKNRMLIKILSVFLAMVLLFCAVPFCERPDCFSIEASAEIYNGSCGASAEDSVNWSFDSETGVLDITGEGAMGGFSSAPWSSYNESIKKVNIADGVTSIGKDVFSGVFLESVTIPQSVASIGEWAFFSCKRLKSIELPGVTRVGEWAFHSCEGLESVTFFDSLESIGDGAFAYCKSLKTAEIPKGVTSIGDFAFYECTGLTEFIVDSDNKNYLSDDYGVLYNKDKTKLIQYPMGNERKIFRIPDGVRRIEDDAFDSCVNLTNVVIPDSVESIGGGAFGYCPKLVSVTIPYGVTSIGGWAFASCTSLTSITIPGSVTEVGNYAFTSCDNLETVYFSGTKEEWEKLSVGTNNESFSEATVKFDKNFCEHDYKAVATPPTCTEQGYTTYICPLCDDSYIDDNIIASGHDWSNWQVLIEPTETEEGTEQRICEVCEETEIRTVPPTGIFVSLTDFSGKVKETKVLASEATEVAFENLEEDECTVTVSKATYATRKYTVKVVDGKVNCEFKLNRIGDINGDGYINVSDYARILRHVKKISVLDGYEFDCADINEDGKISVLDYAKVLRHVKKIEMLW